MYQYISIVFQILAFVFSVFFYRKYKNQKFYKYFLVLMFIIALVEGIGTLILKTDIDSYFLSYYFILIQGGLMTLIYRVLIKKVKFLLFLFLSFVVLWIINYNIRSHVYSVIIFGSINIATYSLFYFRELLLSNEIFYYKKLLSFWVSVSFLIFHLASVPFFFMLNFMQTRGLFFILNILIILMNIIIIYGILCSKREEKY